MLIADSLAYFYLRNPQATATPSPKPLIPPPWKVEIIASRHQLLRSAHRAGRYLFRDSNDGRRLQLPPALLRQVGDRYAVKKALKEVVHFDFHNLKTEYLPQRNDVIFCRNVMMYFDEPEQKRLLEKFSRCLNPRAIYSSATPKACWPHRKIRYRPSQQRYGISKVEVTS